MKINKSDYQSLQRYVNKGHEPWRLDGAAVAAMKILEISNAPRQEWNAYAVPVKLVLEGRHSAVYEYASDESHTSYRITLQKFDWLLTTAKKWDSMIWVPTETVINKQCDKGKKKDKQKAR